MNEFNFDPFDNFIPIKDGDETPVTLIEAFNLKHISESTKPTTTRSSFIYELRDIMKEHALTVDQAIYLLASIETIDWELTGADALSLVNKGLIRDNKVNQTVLFRTRPPIQGVLDLNFESAPHKSCTEETLALADKLEERLVPAGHQTAEYRKTVADEYFKGDTTVARYYIIFRHLFPVGNIKANIAWNKHFGFTYSGITLWDSNIRVAKKFHEIYRKKDIGLFLSGAYYCVRDSINIEEERCFMTKPYKFLASFEPWYELAKETLEEKNRQKEQAAILKLENESNKSQAL